MRTQNKAKFATKYRMEWELYSNRWMGDRYCGFGIAVNLLNIDYSMPNTPLKVSESNSSTNLFRKIA